MSSKIKAGTSSSGVVLDADNTGILELQSGSTPTTAVTIDTSQNVGIGTTSPTGKLDVSSSSAGVTAGDLVVDTANKTVYVGRQSSTGGDNSYLVVRGRLNGSGTNQAIVITGDTSAYGTGIFRPGNDIIGFSTLATERMRINSTGQLIVNSTATLGGMINSYGNASSAAYYGKVNTNGDFVFGIQNQSGTVVGGIVANASTTSYNTSSDYRLKENIVPMTGALATVTALKPCTYKWKLDGKDGQGFIAHELQAILPDAVSGEKDAVETYTDEDGNEQTRIKAQGIDTSFLVATLTSAIQELNAKVDAQALEIQALKAKPTDEELA